MMNQFTPESLADPPKIPDLWTREALKPVSTVFRKCTAVYTITPGGSAHHDVRNVTEGRRD